MNREKTDNRSRKSDPKRPLTLIAVIFLIVGLAVIGGYYFEQSTRIIDLDFTGYRFTSGEELQASVEKISPVGMLADSVEFGPLIESVRMLPYVDQVDITMGYRGKLVFNITEREPLALLVDGSRSSYVAKGGIRLPIVPEKTEDVPLVYGFPAVPLSDTLQSNSYRQVEEFLLAARKNRFGWITISEVAWNEREGVIALTTENGVKLLFGHSDFETRIKHWQVFYEEVISKKGIESFQQIDLRFRDQVVTKES